MAIGSDIRLAEYIGLGEALPSQRFKYGHGSTTSGLSTAIDICTIKLLLQRQWIPSARRAVEINPANAPATHVLQQALPDVVIPPEHPALLTAGLV